MNISTCTKFAYGTRFPWSVPSHVEITTVCGHKGLLIEALHRNFFFNFRAIDICWSRRRSNMMLDEVLAVEHTRKDVIFNYFIFFTNIWNILKHFLTINTNDNIKKFIFFFFFFLLRSLVLGFNFVRVKLVFYHEQQMATIIIPLECFIVAWNTLSYTYGVSASAEQ